MSANAQPARIPPSVVDLLTTTALAHLTTTGGDGSLVSHLVWVDYDGEHVLTSSPKGSYKGRNIRARPQVAISVADPANAGRVLSISGRVTAIRDDDGLAFINKLSQRYNGRPYWRSTGEREIFEITPDRVRARG
jgi:PPOX class probable F420-dependent enzyme